MLLYTAKRSDAIKEIFPGMKTTDALKMSCESSQQIKLFRWIKEMEKQYPAFTAIYAVPNGGKRSIKTAVTMKAEGQRSGVWDIHVPIPRFGYAGLYIEMKWSGNLSDDQKAFMRRLEDTHIFAVCYTYKQASNLILDYFTADNITEIQEMT